MLERLLEGNAPAQQLLGKARARTCSCCSLSNDVKTASTTAASCSVTAEPAMPGGVAGARGGDDGGGDASCARDLAAREVTSALASPILGDGRSVVAERSSSAGVAAACRSSFTASAQHVNDPMAIAKADAPTASQNSMIALKSFTGVSDAIDTVRRSACGVVGPVRARAAVSGVAGVTRFEEAFSILHTVTVHVSSAAASERA